MLRRTLALVCSALMLALSISGAAQADPEEGKELKPKCSKDDSCEQHGFDSDLSTNLLDSLVLDDSLWEQAVAPTPNSSCTTHLSQRDTTEPTDVGHYVVPIYLVPSGATDRKLDLPKNCPGGAPLRSPIQEHIRGFQVWMSKETNVSTYPSSQYRRYYKAASRSYTNPNSGVSGQMTEMSYLTSATSSSIWDCREPSEKLAAVENVLEARGFTNPDYKYIVFLEARQFRSCTDEANVRTAGLANYTGNVAYGLVNLATTDPEVYVRAAIGCDNKQTNTIYSHELTHMMGAVPPSAPNYDTGHPLHTYSINDVMYWRGAPKGFSDNSGNQGAQFDHAGDDYRTNALTNIAWDTDGSSYLASPYKIC